MKCLELMSFMTIVLSLCMCPQWLSQLLNLLKKVKAKVILSESGSVKVKVIELK